MTTTAGRGSTRDAIFRAGADLFAQRGFADTGVREIAALAGVTPALVIRYFGSKEQLFLETVALETGFSAIMNGPLEGIGEAIVAFLVGHAHEAAAEAQVGTFAALMRATDRPAVRESLLRSLERDVVAPLAPRMSGADRDLRARLVSAQLSGLLCALELVDDPGLHGTDPALLARLYGRSIQLLVDGG
jgi:AcrR family transcriptional regulator